MDEDCEMPASDPSFYEAECWAVRETLGAVLGLDPETHGARDLAVRAALALGVDRSLALRALAELVLEELDALDALGSAEAAIGLAAAAAVEDLDVGEGGR